MPKIAFAQTPVSKISGLNLQASIEKGHGDSSDPVLCYHAYLLHWDTHFSKPTITSSSCCSSLLHNPHVIIRTSNLEYS